MADRDVPVIEVVLATYNGEAFLGEQLRSIAGQTYPNWRLLVRDDGSTDATTDLVEAFRKEYPDRVVVLKDGDGNLGYVGNFSRLLEHSSADYVALCDQDDVWLPEKLALTMAKMIELETHHDRLVPTLVFTDLRVVDRDLTVVSDSFWRYQRISPSAAGELNRVLMQNMAAGCTMLLNRRLLQYCIPIPAESGWHDWWLALAAAALGTVAHIPAPTVLYRQHGANAIGARSLHLSNALVHAVDLVRRFAEHRREFLRRFDQAEALLKVCGDAISADHQALLSDFCRMPSDSLFGTLRTVFGWNMLPPTAAHWLVLLLFAGPAKRTAAALRPVTTT